MLFNAKDSLVPQLLTLHCHIRNVGSTLELTLKIFKYLS